MTANMNAKKLFITVLFTPLILWATLAGDIPTAEAHRADYADLVERLMPSVVNIRTAKEVPVEGQSPFNGFIFPPKNFPFQGNPNNRRPQKRQATSLGSGFITDNAGIVVTNYHVVDGADEIFVGLQSGESYSAELVGQDERTDIAVLRIQDPDQAFKAIKFGNSDRARVGDAVLAIGNPLGLGGTVTSGIISARGRDIKAGPYDDFIQTDASINRGNSGGPLFNDKGEVIGITTAIFSQSGGSIGIGFAIPAEQAKNVITQLLEFGTTRRGWLGVNIQPVSEEIAQSVGLADAYGALVSRIYEGSPAGEGGLKVGDIILRFDGKRVENSRRLPSMVAQTAVESQVQVEVWRAGKRVTLSVRLGELEKVDDLIAGRQESENSPQISGDVVEFAELGLALAPFSNRLRDIYGLDNEDGGLVVVQVVQDSAAQNIGMAPGFQILQAGQQALRSAQDLRGAITATKESGLQHILLLVRAGDDTRFLTLPLKE